LRSADFIIEKWIDVKQVTFFQVRISKHLRLLVKFLKCKSAEGAEEYNAEAAEKCYEILLLSA
jgi:hypothetical protein